MTYSQDLRDRVVAFVKGGGTKSEASRRFKISRWCVYEWMTPSTLDRPVRKAFYHKLNPVDLQAHVEAFPDAYLHERATHFAVSATCIFYALKSLKISHKKNATLP
jgi:hypothetical protein